MEEKINAICIRQTPYKDNDIMLTLFSLEHGLVDCILRGAKKPNAKLKFCGELFCFSEYVLVEKQNRRTVIEANQIDDFYNLRVDLEKYYTGLVVLELLRASLVKEEKYYNLFLITINCLRGIVSNNFPERLYLVKFFMEATADLGYGINYDCCQKCAKEIKDKAFFDFDTCQFVCQDCSEITNTQIRYTTYSFLKELSEHTFDQLKGDKSTYSPTFYDLETLNNGIKFYKFFISDKIGIELKCVDALLDL